MATGPVRYTSLCGMLGYGYPTENLEQPSCENLDFVGADNGSIDPGPYYLGHGISFVKPIQTRRDLEPALLFARAHAIPLIIGTAGGAGARPHVDAFVEIVSQIARKHDLHFRMAVIYADIDPHRITDALAEGRIASCGAAPELTTDAITATTHLVGQMGTDPFVEALAGGADVIIAGRSCDTAIFASYPIWKGLDPGLSFHAAKIAECGALCAIPAGANDSLSVTVDADHFVVEPINPERRCTPESVAAHSLYEQPDPGGFDEPEGRVDFSTCVFDPAGDRGVRVSGTRLVPSDIPTIKLEGARAKGYRTITVAGVRDPGAIAHLDDLEAGVREKVASNIRGVLADDAYTLSFLRYGIDAVTGPREGRPAAPPREVGMVIEAIAPTQELADTVLSLARSTALHQPFPGRKTTAGNLAFPYSPSDVSCGPVYDFSVYHLWQTDETPFGVEYREL